MENARFLWQNLWDTGTLSYSSQHPTFPATNSRHRHKTNPWRSRYDDGSGWGYFLVEAGVNDKLDFDEGGAEITATLTAAVYNADTIATEVGTQMTARSLAVGAGWTYVCSYSDSTNKFTIEETAGPNNFTIRWNTGTNKAVDCSDLLGYSDAADDNGASASFEADDIRIHSEEWLKVDKGAAIDVDAFVILNHNLSSAGTMKIQGHTGDTWAPPDVDVSISLNADIIVYFWASTVSKRWWRYYIQDEENSDLYTQAGRLYLGSYFEVAVNFRRDYENVIEDPSDIMMSEGRQITTNEKEEFETLALVFEYMDAADLATFEAMYKDRKRHKELFFCRDADNQNTTTLYARFAAPMTIEHILRDDLYRIPMIIEELS